MHLHRNRMASAIALILICSMVSACGGGGSGIVRGTPIPATPPPPPPPPPPAAVPSGPCPMPITGNCLIVGSATQYQPGGRQSDHALIIGEESLPGHLELMLGDDSRFDAGVSIPNGTLRMSGGSIRNGIDPQSVDGTILDADVTVGERGSFHVYAGGRTHGGILKGSVRNDGEFLLYGAMEGHLDNRGRVQLHGAVGGDVSNQGTATFSGVVKGRWLNHGRLDVGDAFNGPSPNRIEGDFRQSSSGVLGILLSAGGTEWWGAFTSTLTVDGRADLDGSLELRRAWYNDYGAWYGYLVAPLPTAPLSIQVLHATGGVFGRFADWKAATWLDENDVPRPLFITGSLRYGTHDVWFDLTRVSIEAIVAGLAADGMTLASAGNVDRALASIDGTAHLAGTPTPPQQRFLAIAARLLWQGDAQQALRSLDSMAGHGHARLALAQQGMANAAGSAVAGHVAGLRSGDAGHWSNTLTYDNATARTSGHDHWLGPRMLIGGSVSEGGDAVGFARLGGQALGRDRMATLYLHHRGDRWAATAVGVAGRSQRLLQRSIELGDDRAHIATARRALTVAGVHAELARPVAVAGGTLQPFAALNYAATRSAHFQEAGDTGFELVAADALVQRLEAGIGSRYARAWQRGQHTVGLRLDWQWQRPFMQRGTMPAAFVGAPVAAFDLGAFDPRGTRHIVRFGLEDRRADGWRWALQGEHARGLRTTRGLQLQVGREF